MPMRSAILSIGDELILGQCVDTNSAWLSDALLGLASFVDEHRTVGDDRQAIAEAVGELCGKFDVLVITGGLGPTDDDVTREALGDVFNPGDDLILDDAAQGEVKSWFAGRDRKMPAGNIRQAMRPGAMSLLSNEHGTAPGLAGEQDGCLVYALPGPPREMKPMFARYVAPMVRDRSGGASIITMTVHACGIGESAAAEMLGDMTKRDREPMVGITASQGIISARIRATGDADSARAAAEADAERIASCWAPFTFGRGEMTVQQSIGELLMQRGQTLATAESCTGGWVGRMLVDTPGSSAYYLGGWVTYANAMKQNQLDVPAAMIEEYGAVSAPVVQQMATQCVLRSGADWSIAISGVAGPDSSEDKPAGLVYIGVAGRRPGEAGIGVHVRQFRFRGGRQDVRSRAALFSLQALRLELLDLAEKPRLLWESSSRRAGQVDGV